MKCDPPRESIPTGGRDFGLMWSVGTGVSGIYRTQQTQLTTSSNLLVPAGVPGCPGDSFSGPPFTSEGRTKSGVSFGSAGSLQCAAPAGVGPPDRAVRDEAALDSFHWRTNSSGEDRK